MRREVQQPLVVQMGLAAPEAPEALVARSTQQDLASLSLLVVQLAPAALAVLAGQNSTRAAS